MAVDALAADGVLLWAAGDMPRETSVDISFYLSKMREMQIPLMSYIHVCRELPALP